MNGDRSGIAGMLGIAAKAGKLRTGEFGCERSVNERKACLCLLAEDASQGTKEKFTKLCLLKNVPCRTIGVSRETLGHVTGKGYRAVAAIEDANISQAVEKMIGER